MIDLAQSATALSRMHKVSCDPGTSWASESIAIDAPPDNDINPAPETRWPAESARTGLCGAVSPRVVARYRMYYECCDGPQSCQNSIRSAVSADGLAWSVEPGARFELKERIYRRHVSSSSIAEVAGCTAACMAPGSSVRSPTMVLCLTWNLESASLYPCTRPAQAQRTSAYPYP